ncbi:MAG: pantoate--beta-alanine ligase [Actinobacteria bacterium]|nr:pantoate--beta-alanine ligase [Actinomycetota bacterium]
MKIIKEINTLRNFLKEERKKQKTIGFVPTMGFFHQGHLKLIQEAKKNSDVVVVSIFVNPTQFGPNEDFNQYPRDLKKDIELAEKEKVDYLFTPSVQEIYQDDFLTYVNVEELGAKLCGKDRPVHFKGVTTVVAKLFNIVNPDKSFFGEKDAQQLVIIKKMVKDLNFDVEIIGVPTVREEDGLAMSSRNIYLNLKERKAALVLFKSLELAKEKIEKGERNSKVIKNEMEELIKKEKLVNLIYISVSNAENLEELDVLEGKVLIALAAKLRKTRLIDNLFLNIKLTTP